MTKAGSIAANFHEGSRSEYLAQFVFSSFGTAIPVPHQEDSGLDIYCTLLERDGRRAWPRAYYSVQVKSTMAPWVFDSPESVRWLVEHPLPIFLCVVQKSEARILVYSTTPRFAVWALPVPCNRLQLIPETETRAKTSVWQKGNTFRLRAPILDFTIQDVLDGESRARIAEVLKFWIGYDVENLSRIRDGIPNFLVPSAYETNATELRGIMRQGGPLREETLRLAQGRLGELLETIARHYHYYEKDVVTAVICAMALRQLSLTWSRRIGPYENPREVPFQPIDTLLHGELNRLFGMEPPSHIFQACDSLLKLVKEELARHGIDERQTDQ